MVGAAIEPIKPRDMEAATAKAVNLILLIVSFPVLVVEGVCRLPMNYRWETCEIINVTTVTLHDDLIFYYFISIA